MHMIGAYTGTIVNSPGNPTGGVTPRAEVERLRDGGVTAQELTRARSQALADFWRGLATIDGKARLLGEFEVFDGDHRKLFEAPATYERILNARVYDVAIESPLDREHYVTKQIKPVAEPVLETLGLDFEQVIGDSRQFDMFG